MIGRFQTFNELLLSIGICPSKTHLFRPGSEAEMSESLSNSYRRHIRTRRMKERDFVACFKSEGDFKTVFNGIYGVDEIGRDPKKFFYDQIGSLEIDWGEGFSNCVQRADYQDKELVGQEKTIKLRGGSFEENLTDARDGNKDAQRQVGFQFAEGNGTQKDANKAVYWLRKASKQGDVTAQSGLGAMLSMGQGIEGETQSYEEALNWLQKAAKKGDVDAIRNLGGMYYYGRGVQKDDAEAERHFLKAAELGHPGAQLNMGVRYKNSPEPNIPMAEKWFRKAANQGDDAFNEKVGYRFAIRAAQYNLGWLLEEQGEPENLNEAVKWYKKASEPFDVGEKKEWIKEAFSRLMYLYNMGLK